MKKLKEFLKANWLIVLLVLSLIALTTFVSAEYIANKTRIRRVAVNEKDEGQLFSSNYLIVGPAELIKATYAGGNADGYCVVPISIWNHSETNPQKAYQGEISYTWTMQLVDRDGNIITSSNEDLPDFAVGYSSTNDNNSSFSLFSDLVYDSEDGYSVSGSRTFNSQVNGVYVVGEHHLYVRFPQSVLTSDPGIYVKVTAVPTDTHNFSTISAIIGADRAGEMITRGWTGSFADDLTQNDYDAFNYVITGSGSADITLSWRTDKLEMNRINIEEYGWAGSISTIYKDSTGSSEDSGGNAYVSEPEGGTTWKVLEFTANSDAVDGEGHPIGLDRYGIQFFMTDDPYTGYGSGNDGVINWSTVNGYVTFSAD